MEQTLYKKCPMTALMDKCIGEKCQLWATATIRQQGKLGQVLQMNFTGCAFVVQLAVMAPPQATVTPVNQSKNG